MEGMDIILAAVSGILQKFSLIALKSRKPWNKLIQRKNTFS